MGYDFDFGPLYFLAIVGLVVCAVAVLIGVPAVIWWLYHHVAFV